MVVNPNSAVAVARQKCHSRASRHLVKGKCSRSYCKLAGLGRLVKSGQFLGLNTSIACAPQQLLRHPAFGTSSHHFDNSRIYWSISVVRPCDLKFLSCGSIQLRSIQINLAADKSMSGRGRGRGEYYRNKYGRGSSGRFGGGRTEQQNINDGGSTPTLCADQLRNRGGAEELNSHLRRLEGGRYYRAEGVMNYKGFSLGLRKGVLVLQAKTTQSTTMWRGVGSFPASHSSSTALNLTPLHNHHVVGSR